MVSPLRERGVPAGTAGKIRGRQATPLCGEDGLAERLPVFPKAVPLPGHRPGATQGSERPGAGRKAPDRHRAAGNRAETGNPGWQRGGDGRQGGLSPAEAHEWVDFPQKQGEADPRGIPYGLLSPCPGEGDPGPAEGGGGVEAEKRDEKSLDSWRGLCYRNRNVQVPSPPSLLDWRRACAPDVIYTGMARDGGRGCRAVPPRREGPA